MKDACESFRGKKITLLGLGVLGRGVGDAEFLAKCDARLIVTDVKTSERLSESVERLEKFPNIEFHLGGHQEKDFSSADLVIKAAGVPLQSKEIVIAKKNNVPVAMSTALFAKYAMEIGATIVGVTGTRGKSTTTQMIYEVLKTSGKKVLLGGNVRGISTLAMLPEVTKDSVAVLELDSWQLQGFGDVRISPNVSVFTNLTPDHQNYYPSMEEYFSDKANIFRYQKSGDTLIVGKTIFEKLNAARPSVAPHVPQPIPNDWNLKIIGEHNRDNASFAVAALRALKLSDEQIKKGVETFEGVEGRLQFVREVRGVKIYNDNNSTTPEATVAALRTLGRGTSLIVGGSEKNLNLEELVQEIKKHVSRVILLTHSNYEGSKRLASLLEESGIEFGTAENLNDAVASALRTGSKHLLFSPAFASFGMFKNEYERNDQFLDIVRRL